MNSLLSQWFFSIAVSSPYNVYLLISYNNLLPFDAIQNVGYYNRFDSTKSLWGGGGGGDITDVSKYHNAGKDWDLLRFVFKNIFVKLNY